VIAARPCSPPSVPDDERQWRKPLRSHSRCVFEIQSQPGIGSFAFETIEASTTASVGRWPFGNQCVDPVDDHRASAAIRRQTVQCTINPASNEVANPSRKVRDAPAFTATGSDPASERGHGKSHPTGSSTTLHTSQLARIVYDLMLRSDYPSSKRQCGPPTEDFHTLSDAAYILRFARSRRTGGATMFTSLRTDRGHPPSVKHRSPLRQRRNDDLSCLEVYSILPARHDLTITA
jgi:hypothetical protein